MIRGMGVRVPGVYLGWASLMYLAFFPFNEINNLRAFNVAFSSIPTAPTKSKRTWFEAMRGFHQQEVKTPTGTSRRDSADVGGACSAAKFVVEGAGEEYDAPEIEPNRKSRLKSFVYARP